MKINQYTIALIDDDQDDLVILTSAFRESYENAAILTFPSGDDFIQFLKTTTSIPNLVVTDLYMPKLDGLELISLLKADPRTDSVTTILLSTLKNHPVMDHVATFKNVHYFLKPNNYVGYVALTDKIMNMIYAL